MTVGGDYCGLVNGKNVYGEYVGYMPFHVRITHDADGTITLSDILISTDAATSVRMRAACARAGLRLSSGAADIPDITKKCGTTIRS